MILQVILMRVYLIESKIFKSIMLFEKRLHTSPIFLTFFMVCKNLTRHY